VTFIADHRLEPALRGRPRRKHGLYHLTCSVCGGPFTSRRADAETCSPKCRMRRHRQQEALSQIRVAFYHGGCRNRIWRCHRYRYKAQWGHARIAPARPAGV